MNYRLLSPAKQELADAVEFYEAAVTGLGLEFPDEVERTIRLIALHPQAWNPVSATQRRCRIRRFPYGLIYSINLSDSDLGRNALPKTSRFLERAQLIGYA